MPAGAVDSDHGSGGPEEKVVRVDGYIVREHSDGRVTIGPYTFSPDGKSFSKDSSLFFDGVAYTQMGWGSDEVFARELYQKYLKLKAENRSD